MLRRLMSCSFLLAISPGLLAQPTGGGYLPLTLNDATAPIGGTLSVPALLETSAAPINFLMLNFTNDPGQLAFTGWSLGSGMQSHIAQFGSPPSCDTIIYPSASGLNIVMVLAGAYDVGVHGQELIVLHYDVEALSPGTTQIEETSGTPTIATITIDHETPLIRGDVDGSKSCSVADVVRLLAHLFAGESLVCMDSADIDDNGSVNLGDAVQLLGALFGGSAPLDEECRLDTTVDSLPNCAAGC
ncbi:MAG: hypothetical protein AB7O52_01370 [Planctomycetota bacterium]